MAETFTDVHALSKFADLDTPTAAKLNANWDKIDSNMVKAAGAYPSTFPTNKLLMRTDLPAFFINTGTHDSPVWTQIPPAVSPFTDQNLFDVLSMKRFFESNGFLPANKIKESLFTFPTFDVVNASSWNAVSYKPARAKFVSSAGASGSWVYDLGANYSKVLIVLGGLRGPFFDLALTVMKTLPVTSDGSDGFIFTADPGSHQFSIYKNTSGSFGSPLASDNNISTDDTFSQPTNGMAFYLDCANNIQKAFVRKGGEMWMTLLESSTAGVDAIRYAGVWLQAQSSGDGFFAATPLGIYAE